jgi:hypothetical protein
MMCHPFPTDRLLVGVFVTTVASSPEPPPFGTVTFALAVESLPLESRQSKWIS